MNAEQAILIAPLNGLDSSEIIKLISPDELRIESIDGLECRLWLISNKYYTADIYLCPLQNKRQLKPELSFLVESVIIYYDGNLIKDIEELNELWNWLKSYKPSVCLLLCNTFHNDHNCGISKAAVQEWCIKNYFELIELKPQINLEANLEFENEDYGIDRAINALHAHVWPKLKFKESRTHDKLLEEINNMEQNARLMEIEDNYFSNLDDDDEKLFKSLDRFGDLLSNVYTWKNRLSTMPHDEKLDAAFQLVNIAFDEISLEDSDLSEGENDNENCSKSPAMNGSEGTSK